MKMVITIEFDQLLDYEELSNKVINWAYTRYREQIYAYLQLPWWKKIFKKNPIFCLRRNYDDLFSSPPTWEMKLKTIEGTYIVKGISSDHNYVRYMRENQRFHGVLLIRK